MWFNSPFINEKTVNVCGQQAPKNSNMTDVVKNYVFLI